MSKCACCGKCGEPIEMPHNEDELCNKCSPYMDNEAVCPTCGEDLQGATLGYAEWHAQGYCWRDEPAILGEKPF